MIEENVIHGLFEDEVNVELNREKLTDLFYSVLKDVTLEEFVLMITNKFEACIEYANLVQGSATCRNMSLLFNPHRLDTGTKKSSISIYQSLKDKRLMSGFTRVYLFKGRKHQNILYAIIQTGYNAIAHVSDFPPHVVRAFCLQYGLTSESRVLDPCAGWGGRMIGVSSVGCSYEGFEPSTRTYEGLLRLFDFLKTLNPTFISKVHCLPFEDSHLQKGYYDFAITSPPYYDTEFYSDEPTNSLNRYPSFEDWCNGFYAPLITKTMRAIKQEGAFVLNVCDRKYPLKKYLLTHFADKYTIKVLDKAYITQGGLGKDIDKAEQFIEIKHK